MSGTLREKCMLKGFVIITWIVFMPIDTFDIGFVWLLGY